MASAKKLLVCAVAILLSVAIWAKFAPAELSLKGIKVVGICLGALILWLTEAIPVTMSSIAIILTLCLSGTCSLEESLAGMASPSVFLITLGFMIAEAVNQTPVGKRLAFAVMGKFPPTPKGWLLGLFLVQLVLSFAIPGYGVRTALLLPLVQSLTDEAERLGLGERFTKTMLLGLAYGGTVTGLTTLTAAVSNVFAVDLFRTLTGVTISYWDWLKVGVPLTVALLGCTWLVLGQLCKVPASASLQLKKLLTAELQRMGKVSTQEKKCLAVLALVVGLWAAEPITGWHSSLPAALGVLLLAAPGIGVAEWRKLLNISWDIVLLVGASVSLSNALNSSGAAAYLSRALFASDALRASLFTPFVGALLISSALVLYHLLMTSSLTVIATTMPLLVSLSVSTGHNAVGMCMLAGVASFYGFVLVTQNLPNLTVYSTGKLQNRDLFAPGLALSLVSVVVTSAISAALWPALGFAPW
ncbi:MAG: SLC13 family permease [Bacillota bacterium]